MSEDDAVIKRIYDDPSDDDGQRVLVAGHRDAGVRAAAARPCEDRFPRVGQHRMAHLGQPEDRGFARRSIVSANNKPCAFIRCDDLHVHRATANERQCALPE